MSMTDRRSTRVSFADFPKADVLVVLGAAVRPDGRPSPALIRRADHAAALWRAGRAPVILATGGRPAGPGDSPTEAALIALHLTADHGIPRHALLRETKARNTLENADLSLDIIASRGWSSILLVTDALHMPRACWCFRVMARSRGVSPTISPAPVLSPDRFSLAWWGAAARESAAFPLYAWRLRRWKRP